MSMRLPSAYQYTEAVDKVHKWLPAFAPVSRCLSLIRSGPVRDLRPDRMTAVAELWKAHSSAAFPGRLRTVDIAGVEMVMLDEDVAGCVGIWLSHGCSIDDRRWEALATRGRQLTRVLPELSGDEAVYYQRLLDMTVLLLDSRSDPPSR